MSALFNTISHLEEIKKVSDHSESARNYAKELSDNVNKLFAERSYIEVATMTIGMRRNKISEREWVLRYAAMFDNLFEAGHTDSVAIQDIMDREWNARPSRQK